MTSVRIFDANGRLIATLIDRMLKEGSYKVRWNASGFSSGVYFYQIESGKYSKTMKMILIK
jgi:hypothetical protein